MFGRIPDLAELQFKLRRQPVVAIIGPRQIGKTTLAREFAARAGGQLTFFYLELPADLRRLPDPSTALSDLRGLVVIDEIQRANVLEIDDNRLTGKVVGEIIGRQGKAQVLNQIRDELGIKREQIIAIGDGANDLDMMTEAGVSIAYHAKSIVKDHATYSIDHVGLDGVINLFK